MKLEYRIQRHGNQFMLVAPCGEQLGLYHSEEEAKQNIDRCKKEVMHQTAKMLVDDAVKAVMQLHAVDRETARYYVYCATIADE